MSRVELTALYPDLPGEDAVAWTGRVLSHAREYGTNRQCSIGWHEECSDPYGESCNCICHDPHSAVWTIEGHAEGGTLTVARCHIGKHYWPPQEGEPATTWAHWVWATSEQDARSRALAKQGVILHS